MSSASSHFSHFFSTSSPGQIATQSPIVMGESPAGPYNLDSTGSPTSARSKKRPRPTLNIRGNSEAAQNDLESAHSVTGDGPEKRGGKKSRAKKAPGAKSGNGQLSASTNASGSPATSHLPNLPSAASAPLPQHHHDVFQPGNAAPSPMALPRSAMTQQSLGLGFPPVPDMPSVQTQNGPVPGESGSHVDDLFKAFTGFTGTDHAPLSSGGQMSLEEGFDFDVSPLFSSVVDCLFGMLMSVYSGRRRILVGMRMIGPLCPIRRPCQGLVAISRGGARGLAR